MTEKYTTNSLTTRIIFGKEIDISDVDLEKANDILRDRMLEMLEEK